MLCFAYFKGREWKISSSFLVFFFFYLMTWKMSGMQSSLNSCIASIIYSHGFLIKTHEVLIPVSFSVWRPLLWMVHQHTAFPLSSEMSWKFRTGECVLYHGASHIFLAHIFACSNAEWYRKSLWQNEGWLSFQHALDCPSYRYMDTLRITKYHIIWKSHPLHIKSSVFFAVFPSSILHKHLFHLFTNQSSHFQVK